MKAESYGRMYNVRLCFEKLISCDENDVTFVVIYFEQGVKVKRIIKKQLENATFVITLESGGWIRTEILDHRIRMVLEGFVKECNYTFLHYEHTIDYCRTEIPHYLLSSFGIYIADDLIWYALFSTPYSLYNYSQNLTNLKYKRQYDYGYGMKKEKGTWISER
jgi:hypothetical protein